jgi:hypothetical protein
VDPTIAQEILDELFSSLEALETQSAALLQFVKAKGLASEQELAPYLEQAGNASNIRWRAARVRIDHLLSSAIKTNDPSLKSSPPAEKRQDSSSKRDAEAHPKENKKENGKDSPEPQKEVARAKPEAHDAGKNPIQPGNKNTINQKEKEDDKHKTDNTSAETAA